MAQFDREAFKKRVAEKAKLAAQQKMQEKAQNLSEEEKQVLKAYKEWKEKKTRSMNENSKADKVAAIRARIQEKKERQARIEKLQKKLAEKRQSKASNDVAARVKALKEKITKIKARLSEEELIEPALAAGSPVEPAMPGEMPAAQLPPEVVAEIQNIVTAVDSLAVLAGIERAPAVEPGPDVNAAIPGQVAAPGDAPGSSMLEKTNKKAIKEEEEATVDGSADAGEEMTESEELAAVRARIQRRREALKAIRAKALEEGYDGVTSGKENLSDMTPVITVPEAKLGYTANPKKGDDASMKGTATLKAGKTWPTKPAPAKKTFEVQEAEEAPAEGEEKMEESDWSTRHIDRFLEKKELNFKDLLAKGSLG